MAKRDNEPTDDAGRFASGDGGDSLGDKGGAGFGTGEPEQPAGPEPATTDLGEPPKKKRGRPAGGSNRSAGGSGSGSAGGNARAKKVALDLTTTANWLQAGHEVAAKIAKNDLWKISDGEARELARAINGVAEQYDLAVDPKIAAWGQLLVTAGMIYGSRYIALQKQGSAEKSRGLYVAQ